MNKLIALIALLAGIVLLMDMALAEDKFPPMIPASSVPHPNGNPKGLVGQYGSRPSIRGLLKSGNAYARAEMPLPQSPRLDFNHAKGQNKKEGA